MLLNEWRQRAVGQWLVCNTGDAVRLRVQTGPPAPEDPEGCI